MSTADPVLIDDSQGSAANGIVHEQGHGHIAAAAAAVYRRGERRQKRQRPVSQEAGANGTISLSIDSDNGGDYNDDDDDIIILSVVENSPEQPRKRRKRHKINRVAAAAADGGDDDDVIIIDEHKEMDVAHSQAARYGSDRRSSEPTSVRPQREDDRSFGTPRVLSPPSSSGTAPPSSSAGIVSASRQPEAARGASAHGTVDDAVHIIDETQSQEGFTQTPTEPKAILHRILHMFPSADPKFVRQKIAEYRDNTVERVTEYMISNPNFPKVEVKRPRKSAEGAAGDSQKVDYYDKTLAQYVTPQYQKASLKVLEQDFRKVSTDSIKHVLRAHNHRYAPARRELQKHINKVHNHVYKDATTASSSAAAASADDEPLPDNPLHSDMNLPYKSFKLGKFKLRCLANPRPSQQVDVKAMCPALVDEVAAVRNELDEQRKKYEDDLKFATRDKSQDLECGCCFGSYPIDRMAQCTDAHLFCRDCLESYVKNTAFGTSQVDVKCMATDGCEGRFSREQLQAALSRQLFGKLEERQAEQAILEADLSDFVRCPKPGCTFGALLPETQRVLSCQNEECMAETCRECQADWEEHVGKTCKEVESSDDRKRRLSKEDQLSNAIIRKCPKCSAQFVKTDGCNKMTCRCGALSCYICRAIIDKKVGYKHFCQHSSHGANQPRCSKCNKCILFNNWKAHDENEMKRIEKQYTDT